MDNNRAMQKPCISHSWYLTSTSKYAVESLEKHFISLMLILGTYISIQSQHLPTSSTASVSAKCIVTSQTIEIDRHGK